MKILVFFLASLGADSFSPVRMRRAFAGLILSVFLVGALRAEVRDVGLGPLVVPKQEAHFTFTAVWGALGGLPAGRQVLNMGSSFDASDFCRSFAITVDWSTLFGDPVEDYIVEWTCRDQFKVRDSTGGLVTVTKDMLAKYPDLLVRFAALKPKAVYFTVEWSINRETGLAPADRDKIDELARSVYGNVRANFPTSYHAATPVTDDSLILVESGKTPFHTQGIRGWDKFLAPKTRYFLRASPSANTAAERNVLAAALPRAKALEIQEVVIDRIDWPEAEMRAIADKLRAYREGKEKPTPEEEVKAALAKEVPQYTAKDEWAEAADKPRPPKPPEPRKDADGYFSYYDADGAKAFPDRFTYAEAFQDGVAKVSVDPLPLGPDAYAYYARFNYIDESGKYLFPEANRETKLVGNNIFIVGRNDGGWKTPSGKIQQLGLFDRKSDKFLIPQTATRIYTSKPSGDTKDTIAVQCHYYKKTIFHIGSSVECEFRRTNYELNLAEKTLRMIQTWENERDNFQTSTLGY